jgi:hypothetical protein
LAQTGSAVKKDSHKDLEMFGEEIEMKKLLTYYLLFCLLTK